MANIPLEQRVLILERELANVQQRLNGTPSHESPWWDTIFGSFADSSEYDEAMKLGREYRESLRPLDYQDEKS